MLHKVQEHEAPDDAIQEAEIKQRKAEVNMAQKLLKTSMDENSKNSLRISKAALVREIAVLKASPWTAANTGRNEARIGLQRLFLVNFGFVVAVKR